MPVQIGPVSYEIIEDLDQENTMGAIDTESGFIHLKPFLKDDMKKVVLWHEIIHGILWHSGADRVLSEDVREVVVGALGSGLAQFMKDNEPF